MKFKVGQKVVCINDRYSSYCAYPLKKGAIYTIQGLYTCSCGSQQVFLVEVPEVTWVGCKCQSTSLRRHSYYAWRFRVLKYYEIYKIVIENTKETAGELDVESLKTKARMIIP